MKNLPHPIQYQGSKRILAPKILRYFPKNIARLIEPFSGSAAISIAAAAKGLADSYVINDINKPLAQLLQLVIEKPAELATFYETLWSEQHDDSVEHYYQVRERFNRTQDPRLFLYLLARCVKGSVRYNSDGMFNQSPDKRRLGTQPGTMRANLMGVSSLLKGKSSFTSLDYKQVFSTAQEPDLIYMDPPYQGVCGERDLRYLSGISHDEFVGELHRLNSRNISYIVSYDGRRGDRVFGELLPDFLHLTRIEIEAGRSSQSTLLGRDEITYESLYLSSALVLRLEQLPAYRPQTTQHQHALFQTCAPYEKAL